MKINTLAATANKRQQTTNLNERVSFTGQYYPSGYYEDSKIAYAKKYKNIAESEWADMLKKEVHKQFNKEAFEDNHGFYTNCEDRFERNIMRGTVDAITWGTAEAINIPLTAGQNIVSMVQNNGQSKNYVQSVKSLISDLKNEDLTKAELSADKTNRQSKKLVALENEKQAIKDQLYKKFVDLTDLELKGNKVKMPNCIMLVGKSDDVPTELINWTKENADCNFVKVANEDKELLQDQLWDKLNEAKENFTKTKKRTLIHVEGFDSLINPTMNTFENIDGMKDIMQRCASDFGSTIIFKTKDPSKLNNEAIQPHRVNAWIDVRIKSVEELANEAPQQLIKKTEAIVKRLTEARAESRPMNVMNDFITLFAADERKTLKPGYTSYEAKSVESVFKNFIDNFYFINEVNQDLESIFKRAIKMLVK